MDDLKAVSHTKHEQRSQPDHSDQFSSALSDFLQAHSDRVGSNLALLKSEIRMGLLTLMAAAAGAVAAIVLFLTAWVMMMIGIAEYSAGFFATAGANILILALINVVGAIGLYLLARSLVLQVLKIRPFKMVIG